MLQTQNCNVSEYGNSTPNQITCRPVGHPGNLVGTAFGQEKKKKVPDLDLILLIGRPTHHRALAIILIHIARSYI